MARIKVRRKRPSPNYQSFYIQIGDFKPDYSFSVNNSKHTVGAYWEHLEATLGGTFLSPNRLKGFHLSLVFMGRRDEQSKLQQPEDTDWRPRNVGVLTMRGERREFLGSLPYDALWGLIHVFPTDALRIVHLFGILERGRAEIQSVNFARDFDLEDLESASEEAHIT
jgi:hypothetical protein